MSCLAQPPCAEEGKFFALSGGKLNKNDPSRFSFIRYLAAPGDWLDADEDGMAVMTSPLTA